MHRDPRLTIVGVPAWSTFSASRFVALSLLLLALFVTPTLQAGITAVYTGASRTTLPTAAGLSLATPLNEIWPSQQSYIVAWRQSTSNLNAVSYGYDSTHTFIRYPSVNVLSQNLIADSRQLYITFWETAQRIVVCLANGFFTMSPQLTDTRVVSRFATSETNDHIASCAVDETRGVLWLELRLNGTDLEINLEAWNLTSMTPTDDALIWGNATLCTEPATAQRSFYVNDKLVINCASAGLGYVDFNSSNPTFTLQPPLGITSTVSDDHMPDGSPWYLLSVIGIQEWDFTTSVPAFTAVSQALVADSSVVSMRVNPESGTLYWAQNAVVTPTANGPIKITQLGTSETAFQSSLGNSLSFTTGGRGARGFGVDGINNLALVLVEASSIPTSTIDVNLYSFGNCPNVLTCDACVAAADAECGWCLDGTSNGGACVRAQQCGTPRWFQETCPSLTAVESASPLVTGVPFLIQLTTSLFKNYNVSCNLRSTTSSQLVPLSIIPAAAPICGISSSTSPLLSTIAGTYNLEVLLDGYFTYPSPQSVTFVNCSTFSTCGSCTGASSACDWCVYDGQCVNSATSCSTAGPTSQRPTSPSMCPVQGPSSPLTTFVPVPSGSLVTVPATSLISITSSAPYRCIWNFPGGTQSSTDGVLVSTTTGVQCTVPSPPSGFVGHANLSLYFLQHPFADNVESFTFYDCTSAAFSTCDLCLASSNTLCGWNTASGACGIASSCTAGSDCRSTCPTITALNSSSYHYQLDAGMTVMVSGSYFTASSQSTWQCNFGIATTSATYVSATQISCPVPTWTDSSYFTSTRTIFSGTLSVLHNNQAYGNSLPINWYSCSGTNCSSCLNGNKSPKCNWDPMAYSCGTQTSALSACPAILTMSDVYGHINGGLSLSITAEVAPAALSFRCAWHSFSDSGVPDLTAPAVLSGSVWTCTTPSISSYISTSNSVTSNFIIEVDTTSSGWQPFTATPVLFTFYDCALRNSCGDCLLSSQCYWVNYTSCTSAVGSSDADPMHGECPKLITSFPRIQPALVQQTIFVEVNYLPTTDMTTYRCQFALPTGGNPIISQVTRINSTYVSCPFKRTYHDLNNAVLQLSIVKGAVTPRQSVTSNSVPFEIYNCAAATTCGDCASTHVLCGWCPDLGSCTDNSTCTASSSTWTRDNCPFIDSYSPTYAALGRNAKLTFTGEFYGADHLQLACRYNGVNIVSPDSVTATAVVCSLPTLSTAQTITIELVQASGTTRRRAVSYTSYIPDVISFDFFSCASGGMNATDCTTCASAGADPRCVWCAFDALCTDVFACDATYNNHISSPSDCPQIVSLDPSSGPIKGDTVVTITGNLFFQGVSGTACSFGSQVVPATVNSANELTCTSPPGSAVGIKKTGSVEVRVLWNGAPFTRDSSFRFSYKNTDKTTTIAVATVLSVLAFIIILVVILFVVFYKKIMEKRDRTRFLKLREPDYPKVAFAQTKGIDVLLTPGELKQLAKFIQLLEADQNFQIVQALAAASTGQQTDYLARSAVYFYQSRNRALDMLMAFVSAEVKASEHEGTLFRASSFACKLFNQYARYAGLPYLWKTLGFYVNQLAEFAKEERQDDRDDILGPGSMEVDPDRYEDEADAPDEFDIRLNQYELITRASRILKSIFTSLPNMRPEFRQLCARVKSEVGAKFHDNNADYKAVGGFIFLRFLCPSIMAPHIYGLLETAPNETAQRYFVLLSKSLQNLANETLPGTNEDFMARMNEFITKNIEPLHAWVNNLCAGANTAVPVDPDLMIPEDLLNSSVATMQHMLVDEWDQISKSLPEAMVTSLEPIKDKGYLGKKPKVGGKKNGAPPRRGGGGRD